LRRPAEALAPGTVLGAYTVVRRLGAGGYGTVYLAREREGGPCALKLLSLKGVGRRAETEVSILLRLRHLAHPHVVRLLSHVLWPAAAPEFLVIVMEYVRGRAVDTWAREENPSARAVARVVRDVARALGAVHGEGVVHRDVKPSNVLVRQEDGSAVLADFGVGGYPGAPGLTLASLPPGTPEYLSPEVWAHHRAHAGVPGARYASGPADDLWALGVTLYWLLTDRYPFDAPDDPAWVDAVLTRVPAAPHELNARVPEALSRVCLRLLEKASEARYPDARALEAALEEALAGADAAWDVALCDFHDVHTATTKGPVADVRVWANAPARPPRRGPRPKPEAALVAVEEEGAPRDEAAAAPSEADAAAGVEAVAPAAAGPVPADEEPARPVVATAPRQRRAPAWRSPLAVVGLALGLGALGAWWGAPRPPAGHAVPPEARAVQEVAPPASPPDAGLAAAPPQPASTAAAAASPAAPGSEGAPMQKPLPPLSLLKPVKKTLVVGACLAAACSSAPQVRPRPSPEACPAGAARAMNDLGFKEWEPYDGIFTGYTDPDIIFMRAGGRQVRLMDRVSEKLRGGRAIFNCRFYLSNRMYGRCTSVTPEGGSTYPVCLEVVDRDGGTGLTLLEGTEPGADVVQVGNAFYLRRVTEFD
jgi:hypothetical protein